MKRLLPLLLCLTLLLTLAACAVKPEPTQPPSLRSAYGACRAGALRAGHRAAFGKASAQGRVRADL